MFPTAETPKLNRKYFLEYITFKQARAKTKYLYLTYWKNLETYTQTEPHHTIDHTKLTPQNLRQFILKYNNHIVVRAFIKNLLDLIKIYDFPQEIKQQLATFELPKTTGRKKQKIIETRTRTEIHQIAQAMPDQRLQIMTLIGFYLGLRISELINIQTKDLDLIKQTISLKEWAKGGKEREMIIPTFLIQPLKEYLQIRYTEPPTPQTRIFPISKSRYEIHLKKASETTIGKPTKPHTLRRSCATWLLKKGWKIEEIKQYLDHNSIETTLKYIKQQEKEQIQQKAKQTFG